MKISPVKISKAIDDKRIFGAAFRGDKATWSAWHSFLKALFGHKMTDKELVTYTQCTGRSTPPTQQATEAWLVCGRRGGKSFTLALIAVFLAAFGKWQQHLAPGERAVVMIIAADRRQARVILRYVKGIIQASPMLKSLLEVERQESLDLNNRVTVEVHTASFRTVRGYSICAALCDEIAFWRDESSSEPDTEILAALRPAMATMPGSMLLCASSPYARRGVLWETYHRHFKQDGDQILVWQASTETMNPSVSKEFIARAYEEDAASASAEYGGQFRTDIESFVSREVIAACVDNGVHERAPIRGVKYVGFVDPSGGSSDSFTLGIAHREKDGTAMLDVLREVKPSFSPESVVADFAKTMKAYGIRKCTGDRFGGEWVVAPFKQHGIAYEASAAPKSDLYRDLLPMLNSRKGALLDNQRLINQLLGLERRTARSGRDSIDHGPHAHDDVANAAAGALVTAASGVGSGYTLANVLSNERTRAASAEQPTQSRRNGEWTQGELLMRAIMGLKQ